MFGEKAFELIKELDRSPDNLPAFNVRIFGTTIGKQMDKKINLNLLG